MGKYRDVDALSYRSKVKGDNDREHVNHIIKKSLKQGSKLVGEVKFNPEEHKEFVTGFRKRKQSRRLKAMKELEAKARKEKLQFRAEKRAKLKCELGVADDWGLDDDVVKSESQRKPGVAPGEKKVYSAQGVTTTVSIVAMNSEDDNEVDPEEEEEEEEEGRVRAEDFPSSSSMRPKKWRPEHQPAKVTEKETESKGKHQSLTPNTKKLQALLARKKKGGGKFKKQRGSTKSPATEKGGGKKGARR